MPGKLGMGVYRYDEGLADDVVRSGARGCLLMDDALGHASYIKDRVPGMTIVGRNFMDEGPSLEILNASPDERYTRSYNWGRELATRHPAVDVWQGFNELYAPGLYDRLARQVHAEAGFTHGCVSAGRQSCVINTSTDSYPQPWHGDFDTYVNIIAPLLLDGGVRFLGIHAYGSDANPRLNAPDWPDNACRYRSLVQGMRDRGYHVPQIFITEYGQRWGWKREGFGEQGCIDDFLFAGQKWDEDEIMFGAANFLHGTIDPGHWDSFDTAGTNIMRQVSCWNVGQYPCEDGPPPPPPPPPSGGSLGVAIFALVAAGVFAGAYYLTKD
ncbi:MAG: hypothetical protein Q8R28_21775 [Dehalococcoidia bacterium]|nr:hypothetical protein [Dehalococcoidia bacterium]